MARILGIGIATLDIVNLVDRYPVEDEEVRACAQHIRRGGNATNTLVVLSQLGHQCSWGGVLATDSHSDTIIQDLNGHGVDLSGCRRVADGVTPVSYIALSRSNGSRTIVHYRDLPEFAHDDFVAIDCRPFDWIHFEGRNVTETARMLAALREQGFARQRISLELEKPRPGIEVLMKHAGVVLISRAFAMSRALASPAAVLDWAQAQAPDAVLVCTWGEDGAWYRSGGDQAHGAAKPISQVVDTVGAGDTFNAGLIDARLRQLPWAKALEQANALAARKCARHGFDGLAF